MSIFKKLFGKGDSDGETREFQELVEGSMEGLRIQTEAHKVTWRLGKSQKWDFSQETGELVFTFPDIIVRAPAQIVGSFDTETSTWVWAWANSSVAEAHARHSVRVREYGQENGIKRLTTGSWAGEAMDGWRMAALTNRLCETNGVYRGPSGATLVFFTFGKVQLSKKG